MSVISRYTPSTMAAEQLERLFVVREPILEMLMQRVRELGTTPSPHHTLLVGPRGSGKTHLISLVYHRSQALIREKAGFRIAWLPEDPWTIVSYGRLLAAIGERLSWDASQERDEQRLEVALRRSIQEDGPALVLLENLDQILDGLGDLGQQRLRHLLQTEQRLLVIGSTTRLDRNLSRQNHPFFGFFDTIQLSPFSAEDARLMLLALALESGDRELQDRLERDQDLARLYTIAHLAGGQPRIWAMFGSALTVGRLQQLSTFFLERFDDLTPYYQSRLEQLPPQQRLIVAELAAADRPLPVKELADRVGADQRSIAKAMGDLQDRGWVQPATTIFAQYLDRRRTYYELAEPLVRLAFQIKEQRGEPLPIIVDFLISWFDHEQLFDSDDNVYRRAALAAMESNEGLGLARRLTSLPVTRIPSLNLLGQAEDALAALSAHNAEPLMSLPNTVRQAVESRIGKDGDTRPMRRILLKMALNEVGDVPQRGINPEWVDRAERLDEEEGSPTTRMLLLGWLAASWRFDEAEDVLATISSIPEKSIGRDTLTRAYQVAGDLDQAIALFKQTFTDTEQVLGPHHPHTLTSRNNLALAWHAAGNLDQAIALFEQNLTDRERILGPRHPDTLTSRNNLATTYRDAGNLDQAITLHEQTLTDYEQVLGPRHPATLTSRNNLAFAYRAAGKLDRAITLHEQTLTDQEQILGPRHPDTLTSRGNLAGAYQAAGNLDQAITLHEQTLADYEQVLGPRHPHTLASRNNLANAYRDAGNLDRAITLHEQTLADCEQVLGPRHPATLASRNNLATAYRAAGKLDQAITLYEQTLTDTEQVLGPRHPHTLTSRNNLAYAYQEAGNLDQAITLHKQTLTDTEQALGPRHPDTLSSRGNLAGAYRDAGRVDEAVHLYEQALAVAQEVLNPEHGILTRIRRGLDQALKARGSGSGTGQIVG